MRIVAADVGGTKTIIALFDGAPGAFVEVRRRRLASGDYPSFTPIFAEFLEDDAATVDAVGIGVAGPVVDDTSKATNLPWELDGRELEQSCSVPRVTLLNDFAAIALGVGELPDESLHVMNDVPAEPNGVVAILGAGTGLGEAIVVPQDGPLPRVLPSEGGHCDFAARDEDEIGLLRFLLKRHNGRVSFERVLSGAGLEALYEHVVEAGHAPEDPAIRARFEAEDGAAVVSEAAMKLGDPAAKRALSWFCSLYGSEAGNLALKVIPEGGLYVAGGIAPKILPALQGPEFMRSFTTKGRLSPLNEQTRVSVVLDPEVGLLGARRAAVAALLRERQPK